MVVSSELITQFAKVVNSDKKTKKSETTVYGTIRESDGKKYVQIDGSSQFTPIDDPDTAVGLKKDDRVTVMIKNHAATVTGNLSDRAANNSDVQSVASKADSAVETATEAKNTVQEAKTAAADAKAEATKAITAANTAATSASDAKILATTASTEAAEALTKANAASEKADLVETNLANVNDELDSVKEDAVQLREDLEGDIESVRTEMSTSYATKTELSSTETTLRSEISQSATEIQQTVEQDYTKKTYVDGAITDVETTLQTQITQNADSITSLAKSIEEMDIEVVDQNGKISEAQAAAESAQATADAAKTDASQAQTAADNAQAAANKANQAAATAQTAADEAKTDLATAQAKLEEVESDVSASQEDIKAAQEAVLTAQAAADSAQIAADNAAESASNANTAAANAQSKADEAKTAADNAQAAADEAKEDLEALDKRVTIAETSITQNSEAIELRATKTELAGVASSVETAQNTADGVKTDLSSNYYTKSQTESLITIESDSIKSTVSSTYATKASLANTQAEIDDLTIGGRNYFIRNEINNLAWGSADDEHPNGRILENVIYRGYSFPVTEGEHWCLHRTETTNNRWGVYWFDVEPAAEVGASAYGFRSDNQVANTVNYLTVPTGATWGFIYLSNNINEGVIPNVMLEKATKASDWRPAPEDVDNDVLALQEELVSIEERVSNAETSITQNTEAIELRATKTEVSSTKSEAISEAVATASADAQTKANKALSDANASTDSKLTNYSTTTQMNAAITASADGIKSSVRSTYATIETVENIDIGGRNYFTISRVVDLGCTGLASGEQSLISTGTCIGFYIPVSAGEIWTVSRDSTSNNRFDYCFTVDEPASGVLIHGWSQSYRDELEIVGIVVPEGYNYLFLYLSNQDDNMPNIKLEKGNKVTDWTPSPEDMATSDELSVLQSSVNLTEERVSTTETLIEQLTDIISMLVTDGNGESLMTQTATGWTFSTGDIQSIIDSTSENLDTLTNEVGGIDSAVGILQQAVDDLGILNDYVKITTYEGEPCIELGETDSDFKLLITNTRIMFMEGNSVPAYINNQSLFIEKAVIEEELQQGEFVWKARSNGNLGLIWKGATE